jgi:hypothetical protein
MRKVFLTMLVTIAALGVSARAHHSYGATYDVNKEVHLEGKVVQFVLRNPHSFVHVQTKDEKGESQRWSVEWSAPASLGNQGVTQQSLKVGDEVVIVARPSRVPGETRALMVNLKRPSDGFTWGQKAGESVD